MMNASVMREAKVSTMRGWVLLLVVLLVSAPGANAVQKGDVIFQYDFESSAALKTWGATAGAQVQLVPGAQGQALQIERPPDAPAGGSTSVQTALPFDKLRGCKLWVEAQVKAENITMPPAAYNGVKVMLHTSAPGGDTWQQQNLPPGTYDWRSVRFLAVIPTDTTQAQLILGLESVTGKAWFDDIKVTVGALPRMHPLHPPTGPRYTGHSEPRLRGAMISTLISAQDLRDLAGWGANEVRWQLTRTDAPVVPAPPGDFTAYNAWLESVLKHLDSLLPLCRQLGMHVLVDMHSPPPDLFKDKRSQETFMSNWEMMARRYKTEKYIWGYDLVNEPVEGDIPAGVMEWRDLAIAATKRIRAIDPDHAIIMEAAPWDGPAALAELEPLPFKKIVYSFHMYEPGEFTSQGVAGPSQPLPYPGQIGGARWDKAKLRRVLQPVVDWQHDYNVQIYVGEFSAIRWAPGESAHDYLSDCIDIFEENGWDWSYHAFREWSGWSVEHIGDKDHTQLAPEPTSRQKLLMGWFVRNKGQK